MLFKEENKAYRDFNSPRYVHHIWQIRILGCYLFVFLFLPSCFIFENSDHQSNGFYVSIDKLQVYEWKNCSLVTNALQSMCWFTFKFWAAILKFLFFWFFTFCILFLVFFITLSRFWCCVSFEIERFLSRSTKIRPLNSWYRHECEHFFFQPRALCFSTDHFQQWKLSEIERLVSRARCCKKKRGFTC